MARDDPQLAGSRHWKTGTIIPHRNGPGGGFVSSLPPLERFLTYCRFDATTGCVLWTGGTTQGRGHSAPYGAFWFEGRRWAAHRWAAANIHGQDIDGLQVDHCCDPWRAGGSEPLPPNTLCVQHVQALPPAVNRLLQDQRRTWILTQKGYYEPPPLFAGLEAPPEYHAMPIHVAPAWLGLDEAVNDDKDCPF